jgi:Ca2+-binding EF-hand superfamily protein
MREIFREYKRNNFPDEMPSRVWKEILVTSDEDKDGFISVEEIEHTLKNIGASDKVSREEILLLMKELGSEQDDRVEVEVLKGLLHDKRGLGHAKAELQQS